MPDSKVTLIERRPNVVVVRVQPETLDETSLAALRADTTAAGAEAPQAAVLLDLARVSFMPSMSLGGLVQLSQQFKVRGQRLVLTGLQPFVRNILSVTRLDRLFDIQDDVSILLGAAGQ